MTDSNRTSTATLFEQALDQRPGQIESLLYCCQSVSMWGFLQLDLRGGGTLPSKVCSFPQGHRKNLYDLS